MNFLKLLAGLGLIVLALSHSGALLAFGDSLAVIRPQMLVVGAALFFWFRYRRTRGMARLVGPSVALSSVLTIWAWWGAGRGGEVSVTLYQKNLLFINQQPDVIVADIRQSGAELVTLQEVGDRQQGVLTALKADYPYQKYCAFAGVGGTAVLSKLAFVGGSAQCGDKDGLTLVQVVLPGGPLNVASLHLHWPWPYGQAAHVERILGRLQALEGRVLLGGDFNMQPWGASVARISAAIGGERLGGYGATFPRFMPVAPLIIDHVIVPEGAGGSVERRPLAGSDHRGLLARISL